MLEISFSGSFWLVGKSNVPMYLILLVETLDNLHLHDASKPHTRKPNPKTPNFGAQPRLCFWMVPRESWPFAWPYAFVNIHRPLGVGLKLHHGNLQGMGVSQNNSTPKSSHFNRLFHYKPSILGTPIFGNTRMVATIARK